MIVESPPPGADGGNAHGLPQVIEAGVVVPEAESRANASAPATVTPCASRLTQPLWGSASCEPPS